MDLRTSMTSADIVNVLDINSTVATMPSGGNTAATAESVLEQIHSLIPYVAASLQVWDPINGSHRTIANRGYSELEVAHLDTWFVAQDEAFRYMRDVDRDPLRWADMPFDYRSFYSAQTHWLPAGYREGVTTCLFAADGRYTGNLHLNTDSVNYPSDSSRGALTALQSILATLTDVMREPTHIASIIEPDAHCTIVSGEGECHDVPGRFRGPWLATGTVLVQAITTDASVHSRHWRGLWQDQDGGWHRVSRTPLPSGFLVTERSASVPHRLTVRELAVLTLLERSQTNTQIATELTISAKTVGKHIENVMAKLGCTSRTGAAVVALDEGLSLLGSAR